MEKTDQKVLSDYFSKLGKRGVKNRIKNYLGKMTGEEVSEMMKKVRRGEKIKKS